jgi:hypothetical protein
LSLSVILLLSASLIARITDTNYQYWAIKQVSW